MTKKQPLYFQDEDGKYITKEELVEIVAASVAKANIKKCRFPINDEQANETSHLYGMIADIGGGNFSNGIEESRKNHSYINKIRAKSDKFSTAIFMIFIAAVTGGVIKACWEGIKSLVIVNKSL